jgi:hypothetical protein
MARLLGWICAVALAGGVAGCSAGEDRAEGSAGEDVQGPARCPPAQVARVLAGYFDASEQRRLRLRAVAVGYANGLAHVDFRLGGRALGKGALDCETGQLVAIGAGEGDAAVAAAPVCPGKAERVRGARVCVRNWR